MKQPTGTLLVVDDDAAMTAFLKDALSDRGHRVFTATDGKSALGLAAAQAIDVVVTDLRMESFDGLDLLDALLALDRSTAVILMTAFGAVETAIEAVRRGAFHYLQKPFKLDEMIVYVERALQSRAVASENARLRALADEKSGAARIIGTAPATLAMKQLLARAAQASAPVLIRGESGVGKELVARALHVDGPRRTKAFVPVNCTALPEQLLESELFGHARGAFTGATVARKGLFVEADGGTLFLDEIGDMPLPLQAKLLRVLEDGVIRAVGSDGSRIVDVRIVAATHQDLEARAKAGAFRADLLFRLRVLSVDVPPLRARREDIPLLAMRFVESAKARNPTATATKLTAAALSALSAASWPGNVRELENLIERLVILGAGTVIDAADCAPHLAAPAPTTDPLQTARQTLPTLRDLEADYIAFVLDKVSGNKTRAAEILGIDASTLYRKSKNS